MQYDVVIVGSGAGGAAAAYQLVQSGRRVALLERGKALPGDGSTLDVERVLAKGEFVATDPWYDAAGRAIRPSEFANLGGKTKWYGAALLRFAPHEFEADQQHQCPAWPIRYSELEPFYEEAEQLLSVRHFATEPDLANIVAGLVQQDDGWDSQPLPVGLAGNILEFPDEARHFDGFASVRGLKSDADVALLARVRNQPNLQVFTGADVRQLLPAPQDCLQLQGVRCADGREFFGRHIILAAGALHSPRLLQHYVADHELAQSLPYAGLIGRHYKCHLNSALVAVSLARTRDVLRKTTLLTHPDFPHSTVQNTGYIDGELMATQVPSFVPRFASDFVGQRAYGFWVTTEDGSHPDNRVSAKLNGVAGPRIDYRRQRSQAAEIEHTQLLRQLRRQLLAQGYLGLVRRMPLEATAHACGTLMAGNNPRESVVDGNGRVHGFANLYVADGSVLTRSSRVNPALTIYAWGLRVGSRLPQAA